MNTRAKRPSKHTLKLTIILLLVTILPIGALMVANLRTQAETSGFLPAAERAVAYGKLKQQLQEDWKNGQEEVKAYNLQSQDAVQELREFVDEIYNGLFSIMDQNQDYKAVVDYANSVFTQENLDHYGRLQNTITTELQSNAEYVQKQQNGIQARGSKKVGTWAYNDKRGVEWLALEELKWSAVEMYWFVLAVVGVIVTVLAAVATLGLGAVLGALASLVWGIRDMAKGVTEQATKAQSVCLDLCERGKGYTIYRETGWFDITKGYSVFEA